MFWFWFLFVWTSYYENSSFKLLQAIEWKTIGKGETTMKFDWNLMKFWWMDEWKEKKNEKYKNAFRGLRNPNDGKKFDKFCCPLIPTYFCFLLPLHMTIENLISKLIRLLIT